jgi:hypothetical protein
VPKPSLGRLEAQEGPRRGRGWRRQGAAKGRLYRSRPGIVTDLSVSEVTDREPTRPRTKTPETLKTCSLLMPQFHAAQNRTEAIPVGCAKAVTD